MRIHQPGYIISGGPFFLKNTLQYRCPAGRNRALYKPGLKEYEIPYLVGSPGSAKNMNLDPIFL
jgi:hypothetical protein